MGCQRRPSTPTGDATKGRCPQHCVGTTLAGDIIGSVHEGLGTETKDFPLFDEYSRFTDDTVLTIAVAAPWDVIAGIS